MKLNMGKNAIFWEKFKIGLLQKLLNCITLTLIFSCLVQLLCYLWTKSHNTIHLITLFLAGAAVLYFRDIIIPFFSEWKNEEAITLKLTIILSFILAIFIAIILYFSSNQLISGLVITAIFITLGFYIYFREKAIIPENADKILINESTEVFFEFLGETEDVKMLRDPLIF